ncbi:hypothetical protein BDN70DRAFT_115722 [Pholiota conissans]|uniref:DUF6532 domain-containing protein n=1 Tax=Pholiota conissans TaxID=109636 RepID=A0A9P5YZE1_9AGAR|nr:hypothetical protein BDN70DRAFT_115722 [Pholiota conissans]
MDDSNWLPRTRIHLTYQNSTPRVNIKDQSTIMQTVIRRAVDLGELYLVLGTPDSEKLTPDDASGMNTPFSVSGLHSIAITALIASAQEQGCDEEQDVVDRLSEGSERYYIKPLRTHVFQRLSLARTQILGRIASALPPVIKVDKKDKVFIGLLLTKSSYIFPLKEGSKDKFVNTKAYQSDIIQMSLKIGFGSLTGVHLPKLYISSNESPQERELPPFMIAVAATTAYAVLQHLLYDSAGNVAEFSTATLQSVFQAHMVRLLEWKRRHPRLFHKYAHQQYKLVIGVGAGVAGDQTTKEIIDEMDWDNMVDSEEEVAGAPA